MSPLFDRHPARISSALEDTRLARLLKSLHSTARSATLATADLCISQVAHLLEQKAGDAADWTVREHRVRTLAAYLSGSRVTALWLERAPDSADANLLHAATCVHLALSGGADIPSEVVDWCTRAGAARPEDPTPWAVLLDAYRLLGGHRSDVFSAWSEATARDRWHRGAYISMLSYLSPREAGSSLAMMEFVDRVKANTPYDGPCASLELRLHVYQFHALRTRDRMNEVLSGHYWRRPAPMSCLEDISTTWPTPGFLRHSQRLDDLNLLAYALVSAEQRREAAPVFAALRGRATLRPWGETEKESMAAFREESIRCARLSPRD
ncbi:hypothetical protein LMJ38_24225 [Streptomyces sp. R1]|uniref:hypothetical protein n=1 Tax=Streptomyces sp. R1 TaxID=1509279 RepID=UPI001E441D97|nr:hypothetical protein [Streptomyces sp. R1]MCC8339027.1 hypothetical protein [Streptomyces sp. R1]